MNNKKIGITILVLSFILALIFLTAISRLNSSGKESGCYDKDECASITSLLNITHLFVGIIFSMASLGFYLIFFSKGEEAVIKRLEEEKKMLARTDKFATILKAVDKNEQNVLKAIKEQNGIWQATLKFRVGFSKSKLSHILNELEKKKLIKRIKKGKTMAVYLGEV